MHRLLRISLLFVFVAVATSAAVAQSEKKEAAPSDKHESLAQRIGSMVDDVISRIEKELSSRDDQTTLRANGLKPLQSRREPRGIVRRGVPRG